MPEATVVCVDDSEFMRNGDFAPTRMEAVRDAVNMACGNMINSNLENTVGVMTLSDRRETLVTLTSDQGKVLTAVHGLRPKGELDLIRGVQVAQLQLKYMQNAAHQKRIIAFVGSPISATEKELVTLGKKLKKSNIAIDVVSFGETETNTELLGKFIEAVNKGDRSHLVTVPAGIVLSDALMMSDIFSSGGGGGSGMGGGGGGGGGGGNDFAEYGGVNPDIDPELALALRVSMEEERARQQKELADSGGAPADGAAAAPAAAAAAPAGEEDEADAELRRAMEMSMASMAAPEGDAAPMETGAAAAPEDSSMLSEEEQIARALAMSMSAEEPAATAAMDTSGDGAAAAEGSAASTAALLQDPSFLTSVLSTLPNVDPNDAEIRAAVANLASGAEEGEGDAKKEDEEMKE